MSVRTWDQVGGEELLAKKDRIDADSRELACLIVAAERANGYAQAIVSVEALMQSALCKLDDGSPHHARALIDEALGVLGDGGDA